MLKDEIGAMSRAKQIKCESYFYSAQFAGATALPAVIGGQVTVNINITNDSDFLILETTLVSYTAAGVLLVAPDYMMALLDTSSGRQLQDIPAHVNNVTGTGVWPFIWPEPYVLKGGGTLAVTLINNTAVAAAAYVTFIGYKVFHLRGYNRV